MTAPPAAEDIPPTSLNALLGPHLRPVLAACRLHTGRPTLVEACTGGNVSHVFRVTGNRGSVIVKVRGRRFARLAHIATDPALIAVEHRALTLHHRLLPDLFPKVLAFLPAAHAMVMTDVFPDGRSWREHLDQRPATAEECTRLGTALSRVHHATTGLPPLRDGDGDDRFRAEHAYGYSLRAAEHRALDEACRHLDALPGQQLILGDTCPKNLSLASGRTAFVDLETVHTGAPLFDLGYLLAHLVLHHITRPEHLRPLATAFLDAHRLPGPPRPWRSDSLLATVAAGILLYRLEARTVPYPPTAPPGAAARLRRRVRQLLDDGPFTVQDVLEAAEEAVTG
ncbi:Phosphotransferase enzyme family protein [Streptomyces sp. MnatMP-M77]|uniref:phosphotransferase family protein n=1 Tax=unclassified Streptomyces TaxID=2593676 RepID=UPI000804F75A|nr:phosphotransferase [Streptomyces sp. MnatMP-M77]MYT82408.1 phosphotransferase [Streptomyces sp. SID8364]SBU96517.1 Phosphotransferase enzyme family protein [Streptomyces sp. MnatMP-M77]